MTTRKEKDQRRATAISVAFCKAAIDGREDDARALLPECDIHFIPPPPWVCLFGEAAAAVGYRGFGKDLPHLVINRMIEANADFKILSGGARETLLHFAVLVDDLELTKRLLPLVDVKAVSDGGETAVDSARISGFDHIADFIDAYIHQQNEGEILEDETPQAKEEEVKKPWKDRRDRDL